MECKLIAFLTAPASVHLMHLGPETYHQRRGGGGRRHLRYRSAPGGPTLNQGPDFTHNFTNHHQKFGHLASVKIEIMLCTMRNVVKFHF